MPPALVVLICVGITAADGTSTLEQRLQQLEGRFAQLEKRVAVLEERNATLTAKNVQLEQRLEASLRLNAHMPGAKQPPRESQGESHSLAAVFPGGESRRLSTSSCCRWTPDGTCTSTDTRCKPAGRRGAALRLTPRPPSRCYRAVDGRRRCLPADG